MNTFDIHKRNVLKFDAFSNQAEKAEKAKHIEKGEADITKKSMPGEADPKKGTDVLDKRKTEEGTHASVKMGMSGPDNGKSGRKVLDKPITENEESNSISESDEEYNNALNNLQKELDKLTKKFMRQGKSIWIDLGVRNQFCDENGMPLKEKEI